MNIAILIDNFNENTMIRQPWNYAYVIANELASSGEKVEIFTNNQSGCASKEKLDSCTIQRLDVKSLCNLTKTSLETISKQKPDVLYFFGNSLSGIYLQRIKRLNIPLVLHISSVHYSLSDLKVLSIRNLFSHRINLLAALPFGSCFVRKLNSSVIGEITVPSKAIKKSVVRLGVSEGKIHVAPLTFNNFEWPEKNGLISIKDTEEILNVGKNKSNFIITYLGSPSTIRGTDILIDAAKILKNNNSKAKIFMLLRSDWNDEDKEKDFLLRKIRQLSLNETIKVVIGTLPRNFLKRYIAISDILVFPFKIVQSEPPLAILEAMALGKPVITTHTCGLPELVNSKAFIVKPSDASNLAEMIMFAERYRIKTSKLGRDACDYVSKLPRNEYLGKWAKKVLYQAIQSDIAFKHVSTGHNRRLT